MLAGAVLIAGALVGASSAIASANHPTVGMPVDDARHQISSAGPGLVHGAIADVLVRVEGVAVCSGTPITGTVFVVTAAHCVLDRHGNVARGTVVRDGVTYPATAVLVDADYVDDPQPQLDAAVLVMGRVVPGTSAAIGAAIPTTGSVTIAGFQPLDSDGTLLRGTSPNERPIPKGATGTLITIESAPAGCTVPTVSLSVADSRVDVPCGLIPGASGGGMYAEVDGRIALVGIVSTVTVDLSVNGVVPLASLRALLQHPETYRLEMSATHRIAQLARLPRS